MLKNYMYLVAAALEQLARNEEQLEHAIRSPHIGDLVGFSDDSIQQTDERRGIIVEVTEAGGARVLTETDCKWRDLHDLSVRQRRCLQDVSGDGSRLPGDQDALAAEIRAIIKRGAGFEDEV